RRGPALLHLRLSLRTELSDERARCGGFVVLAARLQHLGELLEDRAVALGAVAELAHGGAQPFEGLVTAAERVEELRTHRVRRGAVGIERDGAFAGVERSVELASRAQDGGLELVEAGIGRVEIARAVE